MMNSTAHSNSTIFVIVDKKFQKHVPIITTVLRLKPQITARLFKGYTYLWQADRSLCSLSFPCLLDLCYIIHLRPTFLDLRASTWPSASISACGLNFWPFWPHLSLWSRYTALHAAASPLPTKMLMMHYYGDDIYMMSQQTVYIVNCLQISTERPCTIRYDR